MNDAVHTFVVDDQIHPEMIKIRAELKRLSVLMHDAGFVANTKYVLHDVEEEYVCLMRHQDDSLCKLQISTMSEQLGIYVVFPSDLSYGT